MLLTRAEPEASADGEPLEGDDALAPALAVPGLDPRHEFQGDVLEVEVRVPAVEVDLAGQRAAGAGGSRVEDHVDGGSARTQ
ncbi:hypothetical protein GCM10010421_08840 [Streptomyces glaucus]|uniref:Uncharacterized protein n=1 Tax=Streptomyces glaucus TaxID=284029 RepID=A0ABN3J975_9ACTN